MIQYTTLESAALPRPWGLDTLLKLGDARAVPHLVDALHDRSGKVRAAALEALGQVGDEACVPGVTGLLKNGVAADRALAASALGDLRSNSAVPALGKARLDPSKEVRQAAESALMAIDREPSETKREGGEQYE